MGSVPPQRGRPEENQPGESQLDDLVRPPHGCEGKKADENPCSHKYDQRRHHGNRASPQEKGDELIGSLPKTLTHIIFLLIILNNDPEKMSSG
jgi:hypothetical protein